MKYQSGKVKSLIHLRQSSKHFPSLHFRDLRGIYWEGTGHGNFLLMISFNASMHRRFIKIVLVTKGKDGRDCLHKECRCVKVVGVLGR